MVKNKIEKLRKGQKASLLDTLGTILLAILKALVGKLSGSVALIADAIHDLSDSIVTIAALVGLKIAERKPTEKFPYGYYKAENLVTFFISLLFFYGGIEVLKESYMKLFSKPEVAYAGIALVVPFISALYAWAISKYLMRVGKEIKSQSLVAIAKEARIHIAIAFSVFVGIFCSYFKIPFVESLVGIGIAALIFKVAIETAKDSLYALMDVSPGEEIEKRIENLLRNTKGIKGFEGLKLRRSGPFLFGEVKVKTREIDLRRAHQIADRIEQKAKSLVPNLESLVVHVEPLEKNIEKIAIPVSDERGKNVFPRTARAPYFFFAKVDKKKKSVLWKKVVKNPIKKDIRVGLNVAKFLIKKGVDSVIVKDIGDITFHTLRDKYVRIFFAEKRQIKSLLRLYFEGKLRELKSPTKAVK